MTGDANHITQPAEDGAGAFRVMCAALRDAITNAKEVVGTHAVYNFTPGKNSGVDQRSVVLVKLVDGKWTLVK